MKKNWSLLAIIIYLPLLVLGQSPPSVTGTTNICQGETTILTASGDVGATFNWYDAATAGTLLASTADYTTPTLTATTHYYVSQTVSSSTSTRTEVIVNVNLVPTPASPELVMASESTICVGESTDLTAKVDTALGYQVFWYDALTDGNLLTISNSETPYTVSPTATTTYYAQSGKEIFEHLFNYTATVQTFTVPAGITSVEIDAYGAQGGNTYSTTGPGLGGRVQATMSVTPGEVLSIYVGGQGQSYAGFSSTLNGGWNGGARGSTWGQGAGGGGATDIRMNGQAAADRVLVAGGAGGKGPTCSSSGAKPHGGGLTGVSGSYCNSGPAEGTRGRGGSQTTGGRRGCWWSASYCGGSGGFGSGGVGGDYRGAGGGGGWYGGGGATDKADGGGGSSYTDTGLFTNVIHTQGARSGHGYLAIRYITSLDCSSETRVPITVTVNDNPIVSAGSDVYSCPANGGVTLTASGAATYVWEPGTLSGTSVNINPSTTTTYTVTGTDVNGCVSSDAVIVRVSDLSTSSNVIICDGSSTTLTAAGSDSYTWMPGNLSGASISVSPSTTTTYTVTSNDPSGCTDMNDITVTVNPVPVITASNDTTVTIGFPATLSASGADTYVWNPGNLSGSSVTVTPSTTTTYTVTGYITATNCSSTDQVVVGAVNIPIITGELTALKGTTTELTASGPSGVTFEWFDAENGGNSLATTDVLTTPILMSNRTFYVALNDGVATSQRVAANVTVVDTLTTAMAATTICPGTDIDLKANLPSPGLIHWYDAPSGGNLVGTVDRDDSLNVSPTTTQTYYAIGEAKETIKTFNYTATVQTFTVPQGVTSIKIDAYGARGGNTYSTNGAGLGGRVQATMNVTPGDVLRIYVGGQGQDYAGFGSMLAGGWNGGGNGTSTGQGGGGGGATDIRINGTSLSDRIIVAGGAGGKGPTCSAIGYLPHGGGLTGGSGSYCSSGSGEAKRGRGGSQTGGGRRGCWHNNSNCAGAGGFGYGGWGGSVSGNGRAGGGGGGWYGGGGGTYNSDGGGGSSYTRPLLFQNVVHTQGVRNGHGLLTITYSMDFVASTVRDATIVTVDDVEAPVPDITDLSDATGEYEVTVSPPTATDECNGSITATTADPVFYDQQGTYTILWEFDDGNGNLSSQSQTAIVTSSLPVELTAFRLECVSAGTQITWTTASEINNDFFEIQHSIDGRNWTNIGRVDGAGNSQLEQQYTFIDKRFNLSSNLYRIRQLDFDGTDSYSETKVIECLGNEVTSVSVFPNPVVDQVSVALIDLSDQATQIWITEHTGKILMEKFVQPNSDHEEHQFSLGDLPPGVYNIHVKSDGKPFVTRIVKIGM